jgi:hypothetical protein
MLGVIAMEGEDDVKREIPDKSSPRNYLLAFVFFSNAI